MGERERGSMEYRNLVIFQGSSIKQVYQATTTWLNLTSRGTQEQLHTQFNNRSQQFEAMRQRSKQQAVKDVVEQRDSGARARCLCRPGKALLASHRLDP
eukprot:1499069-Amphidinium_carterae.2